MELGDLLHGLYGPLPVNENAERAEFPAHKLVVADFHTYFVGKPGALVHDNMLHQPTTAVTPGLHAPVE